MRGKSGWKGRRPCEEGDGPEDEGGGSSSPARRRARERGQKSRERGQGEVIIIPWRLDLPAPEAKASSTLKWRAAILQQLAVAAGCCFWRGARGRPRGGEGGCPRRAAVGRAHPSPTHRGCPSCPCTRGWERRGLLLACKVSLGWRCCRMPCYMILGPCGSKKAQKTAAGVLRSIDPPGEAVGVAVHGAPPASEELGVRRGPR